MKRDEIFIIQQEIGLGEKLIASNRFCAMNQKFGEINLTLRFI